MDRVTVALGDRRSDIVIADGLLDRAGALLANHIRDSQLVVVTDANVAAAQLPRLERALLRAGTTVVPIVLPPGEATKSWDQLRRLCDALAEHGVRRGDTIIALGGGVVGDIAGLAAALHLRGCDLVQIPTSLVAQVDSSVGGKVAIDSAAGKNMVGAFHQPDLVIIDPLCLATLPQREFVAGYAEIVKYALIGDADFFAWCEANSPALIARDQSAVLKAIQACIAAKAAIVERDERDTDGPRALLNIGHSFGHAFEALAGYDGTLLHGEAVSAGIAIAYGYAAELGMCDPASADRVAAHLAAHGLPINLPAALGTADGTAIVAHMMRDKKNRGDALTLILPTAIGHAEQRPDCAPAHVAAYLDRLRP